MSYSNVDDESEDDFYRWFVGGSPPEADAWPRYAFESALQHGSLRVAADAVTSAEPSRLPA